MTAVPETPEPEAGSGSAAEPGSGSEAEIASRAAAEPGSGPGPGTGARAGAEGSEPGSGPEFHAKTASGPGPGTGPRRPLVALLSGAGISTDSGIPDYRGPQGLWRRDPEAEKLVTYASYMADPEIRRKSWQMRRTSPTWNARPNAAHKAVAQLAASGTPVRVITQNVDGLHQLAGMPDRKVLELHGSSRTVECTRCGGTGPMAEALRRVENGEEDPACRECGGVLKSATVMFGQSLDPAVLGEAVAVTKASDVFVAVGTSLQVQPAASLAGLAAEHGARLVIVNAEPTPYDGLADEVVREPIAEALPALLRGLRAA